MFYDDAAIVAAVGQRSFDAGRTYQRQGRVLRWRQVDESLIHGQVQGSERKPYDQSIRVGRTAQGRALVSGRCSCPVMQDCKHVAAVLIEGLRQGYADDGGAAVDDAAIAAGRAVMLVGQSPAAPSPGDDPNAMPPALAQWLTRLERAAESSDDAASAGRRLIYVLSLKQHLYGGTSLVVTPRSQQTLKNGDLSTNTAAFAPRQARHPTPPKFLRPLDLEILEDLNALSSSSGEDTDLSSRRAAAVIDTMLASGRARWQQPDGPPLLAGPARPGRIEWQLTPDGTRRPRLILDEAPAGLVVLPTTPPRYCDPSQPVLGPIETGIAPPLLATLLAAPPLPAAQADAVRERLAAGRATALADLAPPPAEPPTRVEGPPVAKLRLMTATLPGAYYVYPPRPAEVIGLARVSFAYGPVTVALGEKRAVPIALHDGRLFEVRRDRTAETALIAGLLTAGGLVPVVDLRADVPPHLTHDLTVAAQVPAAWHRFVFQTVPELRAAGWRIAVDDDFPFRVVESASDISAAFTEGSGIDWLELDLGVIVDGRRVDLVPPLVAMILAGRVQWTDEILYLPLADGRALPVPAARLAPVLAVLTELVAGGGYDAQRQRISLGPADAADVAALEAAGEAAGLAWHGGEKLRALGRRLRDTGGIPPAVLPPGFTATLRPYQAQGVAWLQLLADAGLGGILADDMGLGKTVQALAHIAIEKAAGRLDRPVLVVAPTSLMVNWQREAARFSADLRVLVLHGLDRATKFAAIDDADLVLTTYPLIARDHEVLAGRPWHALILDEAQAIKNPDARTTRLIGSIEARQRFALTGTPLENHLGELWSLFGAVLPGFLGERTAFNARWRTPIEKKGDRDKARLLSKRVRPFMLRRLKESVASELPPKTEITEAVELGDRQRDIYETIRLAMHEKVRAAIAQKGIARSHIIILDALLKLRQACCDPRLLKLDARLLKNAHSAKLDRLDELLGELIAEGRRVLVFSQFTSMLDLIMPRLDAAQIPYSLLTGKTKDRAQAVNRFQDGEVPVFLISLKAGGSGLNLTAADTVILYDPWWNPAVEAQAMDRAHRIGQTKPVFVHKLVAVGTIEEKMELLKEKKRDLAAGLFDEDGAPTLAMTESDIEALLGGE